MHATISWSYDGLPGEVRSVLRQLSVFSGGWTVEGAEAVCVTDDVDVVDALGILLDQHLITRADTPAGSRFGMLETVKEFCRDAAGTAGETDDLHRRHAAWCLQLVARAEPEFARADQAAWLDAVEAEHDNIRSALAVGSRWRPAHRRRARGTAVAVLVAPWVHERGVRVVGAQHRRSGCHTVRRTRHGAHRCGVDARGDRRRRGG